MLGDAQKYRKNYRFLHEARGPANVPSADPVEPVNDSSFTDRGHVNTCTRVFDIVRTIVAFGTGRETLWIS
jgi:hypothetical protein